MKISMVYNPLDCKLSDANYSQTYRDMWLALGSRFEEIQTVTGDCSAKDIDGDIIVFFDPHSSHHIKIEGIENHPAPKYEYMDDPHQLAYHGCHQKTGALAIKLSAEKRIERALKRGIDFIICPYTESYFEHLGPFMDNAEERLLWFPPCPDINRYSQLLPLIERKSEVLANGALVHLPKFYGYEFRKWAFGQPEVTYIQHTMGDPTTPRGADYPNLLLSFAGALALCDTHIPPKYVEIPMAGCVCFAQYQKDYERMGFKDGESCIYVDKKNFAKTIEDFKHNVSACQKIADAGRDLIENNWTSEHFADFIYEHAKLCKNNSEPDDAIGAKIGQEIQV